VLWSPSTDLGALVQVIITLAITLGLAFAVRREKALVQLVIGIGMVVLAWFAFRTLH
jgi:threonine/homoserine/homoserine lactone efflux protein